jgi:hypothetical protein
MNFEQIIKNNEAWVAEKLALDPIFLKIFQKDKHRIRFILVAVIVV